MVPVLTVLRKLTTTSLTERERVINLYIYTLKPVITGFDLSGCPGGIHALKFVRPTQDWLSFIIWGCPKTDQKNFLMSIPRLVMLHKDITWNSIQDTWQYHRKLAYSNNENCNTQYRGLWVILKGFILLWSSIQSRYAKHKKYWFIFTHLFCCVTHSQSW